MGCVHPVGSFLHRPPICGSRPQTKLGGPLL